MNDEETAKAEYAKRVAFREKLEGMMRSQPALFDHVNLDETSTPYTVMRFYITKVNGQRIITPM